MKINIGKEDKIEAKGSVKVIADKGFDLIVKATDCDVDMDLGKVIIRCKTFTIKERKSKTDRRT